MGAAIAIMLLLEKHKHFFSQYLSILDSLLVATGAHEFKVNEHTNNNIIPSKAKILYCLFMSSQ